MEGNFGNIGSVMQKHYNYFEADVRIYNLNAKLFDTNALRGFMHQHFVRDLIQKDGHRMLLVTLTCRCYTRSRDILTRSVENISRTYIYLHGLASSAQC